jgi:hypothetical protein
MGTVSVTYKGHEIFEVVWKCKYINRIKCVKQTHTLGTSRKYVDFPWDGWVRGEYLVLVARLKRHNLPHWSVHCLEEKLSQCHFVCMIWTALLLCLYISNYKMAFCHSWKFWWKINVLIVHTLWTDDMDECVLDVAALWNVPRKQIYCSRNVELDKLCESVLAIVTKLLSPT